MKAYNIESAYCFPTNAVLDTLGQSGHIRQASVTLIAPTKKAAVEFGQRIGLRLNASGTGVHLAGSTFAETLLQEFGDEIGAYATKLNSYDGDVVVRILSRDETKPVGLVGRDRNAAVFKRT